MPRLPFFFLALAGFLAGSAALADELIPGTPLPTGLSITPTAARGAIFQGLNPGLRVFSDFRPDHAVSASVSPDGQTLAILTSGFNLNYDRNGKMVPELSNEYVFLFDITGPKPQQVQVLLVSNTFQGLAWAPSSDRFFVAGGRDDAILEFVRNGAEFAPGRRFALGHKAGIGLNVKPMAASVAVSPDGARLAVTNLENDSVSLVDLSVGRVVAEQDLRPGIIDAKRHGKSGGGFPRALAWVSANRAYVASERDREIISLAISGTTIRVKRRLPVRGQPVALIANRSGSRLYAALDTTDHVAIFDTRTDTPIESVDVTAPASLYTNTKELGGANSNALALTPDERTLLVTNGGENAVAVVRLGEKARGLSGGHMKTSHDDDDDDVPQQQSTVVGLVPTGWYPTGVATSKSGSTWYVVNAKGETGPNVRWCAHMDQTGKHCVSENWFSKAPMDNRARMLMTEGQFVSQLERAGFLTIPAPDASELVRLTKQVVHNDRLDQPETSAEAERLFSFLRAHIKHVIYIIKENRSYDQLLGDLEIGNGDPRLTLFPERASPNHHALARNFVTLDNFLVSGEVSWTGWDWSVSAQTNDFREHQEPLTMANRGLEGEATGFNRNVNLAYASNQDRHAQHAVSPSDPDIVPGEHDVTAPDGPHGNEQRSHIWDMAIQKGLTIRNWGFWGENRNYPIPDAPLVHDPYAHKTQVFFPMKSALLPYSDPYYLDFSPAYPDYWRVQEWKREFGEFITKGSAPNLMMIRLGNDHFGSFDHAIDGVNTPETQLADNDYALGLIVETVAKSPFAQDTLVISIEDDACDGADHVDAHRSIALFAGPYVRARSLVSKRYTTVNVVKTIEQILGLEPIGLNDALAEPMSDVFDPAVASWSYKPIIPDVLRSTKLPLPPDPSAHIAYPMHSSSYWVKRMADQNFSGADRINPVTFNRALWLGLKGKAAASQLVITMDPANTP